MKKILLGFVLLVLLAPMAQAATLFSERYNTFYKNESKGIYPITVTAETAGEITAQNGINLLMDAVNNQLLWGAIPQLSASGTAVDHGKVAAITKPEYLDGYKVLHVPVLADFEAGESVTLNGIWLRAYKRSFTLRRIQADVTGDFLPDASDVNILVVTEEETMDRTPPYAPDQFSATLSSDLKSVSLSWSRSIDFDVLGMNLDRKRVRAGNVQDINLLSRASATQYTDTDIQLGDVLTYTISGDDGSNLGDPVVKTIEVKAETPATPTMPEVTPPTTPAVEPETNPELSQLTKLYGYYKVRQGIKCREGVGPSDSACLWAKIDLIYAQNLLDRSDVQIELSARDLELIALRIVWPEKRYQTECVKATTPDSSCPALEKSIKRAHYFID